MWASAAASIMLRVAGVSGTCSVTKSDSASIASSVGITRVLPSGSFVAMS